jgi:hypothetical protein
MRQSREAWAANPKTEIRNPKEIRRPKPETMTAYLFVSIPRMRRRLMTIHPAYRSAAPASEYSDFGFRSSDLPRPLPLVGHFISSPALHPISAAHQTF